MGFKFADYNTIKVDDHRILYDSTFSPVVEFVPHMLADEINAFHIPR